MEERGSLEVMENEVKERRPGSRGEGELGEL